MHFYITLKNKIIKLNNSILIRNFIEINKLKLYKISIAVLMNNNIINIDYIMKENIELELITNNSDLGLNIISKLSTYILGFSIKKILPNSNLINFNYDNKGLFFYDFYTKSTFNKEIIKLIEINMIEVFSKNFFLKKQEFIYKNIKSVFSNKNEKLKVLFLKKNKNKMNKKYNLCYFENYVDILDVPFIRNINFNIKFKLKLDILNIWYGDKINKIAKRIYGNVIIEKLKDFNNTKLSKNNLLEYKNHRLLNNKLDLYHIEKNSLGMIFWKENGLIIFNELKKLISEKLKIYKYKEVLTPILMNKDIWEKTGHIKYYEENIFEVKFVNKNYCIKPMNCPGHINIFNTKIRSYKDLPYRIAEFGNCHRNELSGSLHGLMRTKNFFQDDGHIFCSKDQIGKEINKCIEMMYDIYTIFGFYNIKVKLSTRPKNKIGDDKLWNFSEKIMSNILKKINIDFDYKIGEGAFYGPKIEFILLDVLNREWQFGTIQLDFFLPKKLNATFINKNNKKENVILIHRAILGSIERFIGIITEEYYGKYPVWLSPIQIVLISITNNQIKYVIKLSKKIEKIGIRYKIDIRNEKLNYKIRDNSLFNIPYMFICGKKEVKEKKVNVRTNDGNNLGLFKIDLILKIIKNKILNRNLL